MKIQELAIIFVIIILPISILLSEYTQFQIRTIGMQTEYDTRLTSATYDAIKAFQLNTSNSSTSDLSNSKMRDLEASINSFRNSIMSGFKLNGYTEEELNNYIPALVYTLYDGFYIYSPYKSTHDEEGNQISGNANAIYGLKPYINYSCRYVYPPDVDNPSIDVVITYALDNYITVQGTINNEYVNKSGYLIDGITYDENTAEVTYNGIPIETEHLKEKVNGTLYDYVKVNGTKYYYKDDKIVYYLNGQEVIQASDIKEVTAWKILMENNDSAKEYYRKAYEFTKWFKSTSLVDLEYSDAMGEGEASSINEWAGNDTKIFDFNPDSTDQSNNIENELSNFNQHRLAVIRYKIEKNLAIAISNYNSYSGAEDNVFQMPELKEDEWEHITHNISVISFLQGLPIGGKIYNGYSLVTNSESKEVVLEEYIYILGSDNNYHKIGDKGFETEEQFVVSAGSYEGSSDDSGRNAGRLNLDFKKSSVVNNDNTALSYYYPLQDYNASYDSIVMQNNVTTYDDIYKYVSGQNDKLKTAFYTALGREREGMYKVGNKLPEFKSVLVAGQLPSNYSVYDEITQYITNQLNTEDNIQATCIYNVDAGSLANEIEQNKDKYNLIIYDSFAWPPSVNSGIVNTTNLITISNDATESHLSIIEESLSSASVKAIPEITEEGKEKLKELKEVTIDNSWGDNQYPIKFKEDVEVLYQTTYNTGITGTYDLVGCYQAQDYKWIHSQLNIEYNNTSYNHMKLLKSLIKYALNID